MNEIRKVIRKNELDKFERNSTRYVVGDIMRVEKIAGLDRGTIIESKIKSITVNGMRGTMVLQNGLRLTITRHITWWANASKDLSDVNAFT